MASPAHYLCTIGLEIHIRLNTRSKLFCPCPARTGAPPNSLVCPVCAGVPGALPVLNRQAVDAALRLALALGFSVKSDSVFARKHYFYPDLPRGYQITQAEQPLAEDGRLEFGGAGQREVVALSRLHIEEDAGKSVHRPEKGQTLVDFNRAGVPLAEVVTGPHLSTPDQAAAALRSLRSIVRRLGISDGDLERGSMRCDANISLRPAGQRLLGARVELKNLNSFRFVRRALQAEIKRQTAILERGQTVTPQTRRFAAVSGETRPLRNKEISSDYRYLDDPDLPPLHLNSDQIERARRMLPELPMARRDRFERELGLSPAAAELLSREHQLADYFEETVHAGAEPVSAAHWVVGEVLARLDDPRRADQAPVPPAALAELLGLQKQGRINGSLAKKVWQQMWQSGQSAARIVAEQGLVPVEQAQVRRLVAQVVEAHPRQVQRYRAGKSQLLGYFVGQVMQTAAGRADPKQVRRLLHETLDH